MFCYIGDGNGSVDNSDFVAVGDIVSAYFLTSISTVSSCSIIFVLECFYLFSFIFINIYLPFKLPVVTFGTQHI